MSSTQLPKADKDQVRLPESFESQVEFDWQESPALILNRLSEHLSTTGLSVMHQLNDDQILDAWHQLLDQVLDPGSALWKTAKDRSLRTVIAQEHGMHPETLSRSLSASLELMRDPPKDKRSLNDTAPTATRIKPAFVALAGNTPILLLQLLMPALIQRRPLLFKLPSGAPTFALAVLDALFDILPVSRDAVAALTWSSAASAGTVEAAVCAAQPSFDPMLIYGDDSTVSHYRAQLTKSGEASATLAGFGSKTSVAVIDERESSEPTWLQEVARDIALFEQQGCLSVSAVLVIANQDIANLRAKQLSLALEKITDELPLPKTALRQSLSAARHWFDAALMAGQTCCGDIAKGSAVVVSPSLAPAPAARCVNLLRCSSLADATEALAALKAPSTSLQGLSIWAPEPSQLDHMQQLFASKASASDLRIAPAGQLQRTDAAWQNGGIDLFEFFQAPALSQEP